MKLHFCVQLCVFAFVLKFFLCSGAPDKPMEKSLKTDKSESSHVLNFLYNWTLGRVVKPILTCPTASKMTSLFADYGFSHYWVGPFIKKNKLDMSQFIVPVDGYRTFNDFFYRKLKPGMRKIDTNPDVFTSPADSKILVVENVSKETPFFVKGLKFDIFKFVKNDKLAEEFLGGTLILFRLAPHDYHRFHFPFDCTACDARRINGKFESVNPTAYQAGVQPLTENERHLIVLNSDKFDKVLFVPVGAMFVGKIIETYTPDRPYTKGDEMGYFAFGGSSVVMIFKKGQINVEELFMQNSCDCVETAVKMGQRMAVKV